MRAAKRAIGEVELDLGRYELRRFGRRVKLEKKPMELLAFLVGRREQMVSREEIVKKLWRSDLFIDTDRNLNNIVRKIRTALGDDSAKPRFVETVVGKGYRFIGPVRVIGAQYPRSGLGQASARVVRQENEVSGARVRHWPCCHCYFWGKPRTTMGCAWGLQMPWPLALETCRGWTCCRRRRS
jgi:DNA-binding winged helix-turn-helix (wHTH) protein